MASRALVRRAFAEYRKEHGIPDRCDNPECSFHTTPLMWNGKSLPVTLDHANGVNWDNRPESLRYLCPNCDSQLETRGGKNKGRVARSGIGHVIRRKGDQVDGQPVPKDVVLPVQGFLLKTR